MPDTTGCEHCTDPDGVACLPLYGLGPHTHKPGPMIGSTELLEEQESMGFTPDPDCPGMGVWWCHLCGHGRPKAEREHTTSADCWCNPELDYIDPETGNSVYVHKRPQ